MRGVMSYKPRYKPSKKDPLSDPEPGLPSIHTVKASNVGGLSDRTKVTSYMREETPMLSPSIDEKLTSALQTTFLDVVVVDNVAHNLQEMTSRAMSCTRFDDAKQFEKFLTEGVLLNITKMASRSIGIPQGEYVVYNISPQKSVLIPTADVTVQETDFQKSPKTYEIHTQQLVGSWNQTERVIAEIAGNDNGDSDDSQKEVLGQITGKRARKQKSYHKHPRDSQVHPAMVKSGLSNQEMADRLGVHPSTVSRYTADDNAGEEPGGRIPNVAHAVKFANALGTDVESLFGDAPKQQKRSKTGGSGGGNNPIYNRGRN